MLFILLLKHHRDNTKNWDILIFLINTYDLHKTSNVLDAGSGLRSIILENLRLMGFKNLHAIDSLPKENISFTKNNISFTNCSVEDYTLTSKLKFDLIFSLSVIEHVDSPLEHLISLLNLMRSSDSRMFLTTDYYPEFIDCSNIYPYGSEAPEMRIFNRKSLSNLLINIKNKYKNLFISDSALKDNLNRSVVTWKRVNRSYSFIQLAFFKK